MTLPSENLAGRGEPDTTLGALEKDGIKLMLKLRDLSADR